MYSSHFQDFLGTPHFQDSRVFAHAHAVEDTYYVPLALLQPAVVTQQSRRHSILRTAPERFCKEDHSNVCSFILGSTYQVEALFPGTAPRTLPNHLYLGDYRGTCSKFCLHPHPVIQELKAWSREQSSSAPCAIQTIRFSTLPAKGPRLFNVLPKNLQNMSGCTTERFKCELDHYLATVPDEPLVPGLTQYRRCDSNSVIDWVNFPYLYQQDNLLQQHNYLELDEAEQRDDLLDPTNITEWYLVS